MFDRALFETSSVQLAPLLLGALFSHDSPGGRVTVRLTEVEAYLGQADPGSHAFRGPTKRNAVMFGPPGRLYMYFTYGMHVCVNLICSPEGEASGILLRAGEVVEGVETARLRRSTAKSDAELARGPARLVTAMDIALAQNGMDAGEPPFDLTLAEHPPTFAAGPRTGVSGAGGTGDYPWRFWIPAEPSVSPYKAHTPKRRAER